MTRGPAEDDDRTIISTSFGDSDLPQFVSSSSLFNHTLPDGTRLGEFEVRGLIGEGGFGIVYLAYDESLQRQVALKEYMPSSLAARSNTTATVSVKSDRHRETFQAGLKSFINEARLLAQFDHPSLVKVYRFWEGHGTAYMVMPYYEGPTLKRALADLGRPSTEAEIKTWLHPLLNALEVMHSAHCFHRDIAPDNILLTASGPLLLDFGAARRVIGDMTHALTVVLKPGYAPIEQYGEESSSMPQGAWTDLYAMACVVYYAVTGKAPMSSVDRLMADKLRPLSDIAAGRYSATFLKAMDACLSVRPHERPQSVGELRAMLEVAPAPTAVAAPTPEAPPAAVRALEATAQPAPRTERPASSATATFTPKADAAESPATQRAASSGRGLGMALAAGIILIALAGLAWFTKGRTPETAITTPAASSPTLNTAESTPTASMPSSVAEPASTAAPTPSPAPSESEPSAKVRAPIQPSPVPAPPKARQEPAALPQKMPSASRRDSAVQVRCGDILQKASLETLSPEETDFLKKECR
ncbi:serine/threonine protein kinase [Aquabacterium sp.]|uniref:serine/threonine protein kinase n=1 Tax=Aquabacterium sp. TaxID=1872578 RepID=UPI003D6C771B